MSETGALLLLAGYLLVALACIGWQASHCGSGPIVWVLYSFQRMYCGWMYRWRSNRRCPFPMAGPALIIANHTSPADPMQLWMNHHQAAPGREIRTISFMMAREHYEKPVIGWICRKLRSVPLARNGRDMGAIRETLRLLKEGNLVGVFPEGRINLNGVGLLEGNPGVGWLALKARVPVFPVFLKGVPGGSNMVAPFLRRAHVRVSYGDPVDLSQYYDRSTTSELLGEVTEILMDALARQGGIEHERQADTAVIPGPGLVRRIG